MLRALEQSRNARTREADQECLQLLVIRIQLLVIRLSSTCADMQAARVQDERARIHKLRTAPARDAAHHLLSHAYMMTYLQLIVTSHCCHCLLIEINIRQASPASQM